MNNYVKNIDKLVEIFDNAEENCVNINMILDANIAYDLTKELEFLGKKFFIEIEDQHEIELEKADSGILSVALSVYDDGTKMYFLEQALYNGVVIKDDGEFTDVVCIQNELLDVIEPDKNFKNVVIAVSSFGEEDDVFDEDGWIESEGEMENDIPFSDEEYFEECQCEKCECSELECECICDEEDSDSDFIAEFIEEEIEEVLIKLEDDECPHCAIGEALGNAFKLGYEQALVDIRNDINIHLGE